MNECNAFAKPVPGGFIAFLRTVRDAAAKPILSKGGKPAVFATELEATREAMKHLIQYINGNLVRDGEIAQAEAAADQFFKPEVRRKRRRGKHGFGRKAHNAAH
ncbi:hypothetical protein J2X65_003542 [Ancylobacter sp. 3268]|uniref:hypothetical protein n=1 Tax=Ancylobacter sp. 3268 TaxID=2817752 RepID=UPI0028620837|nr:hypothetical protein [Ancylobacter sp. 3268]MDR6954174.1 hypothetical protein [Ancylobacter sp. 3268]